MKIENEDDIDLIIPPLVQSWIKVMLNPKSKSSELHSAYVRLKDLKRIIEEATNNYEKGRR